MTQGIAYLRVSSKEQKKEGFSIPAQRKLIKGFAKKEGIKIVKEFEDDETTKKKGRTSFDEMVKYLQGQDKVKNILVEKTDRLYRNFRDYVTLDDLDVTVFLVKEGEIIGKDIPSHQKFIHEIKLVMAKNFIDNLSEETSKGMREKAEQGYYPVSCPPVGYKIGDLEDKRSLVVDEKKQRAGC